MDSDIDDDAMDRLNRELKIDDFYYIAQDERVRLP